jgi:indolepyruvate ferredoxin oxidoreductase
MAKHAVTLDDKYTQPSGRIFVSALQALVRLPMMQRQRDAAAGLNTAGFITGYRGSPLGTYDTALWAAQKHLDANQIVFSPGVNEELAAAAVKGTQWVTHYPDATVDGVFALWYGKHLGVERACEALKQGNYDGASRHGGALILCGDDHGGKSSITAAESDHVYIAAQIPLLYPAHTQEIIDYGLYGWALSRFAGLWVGLKTVTDTVEAAGTIELDPLRPHIVLPEVTRPPEGLNCFKGDYFPLPQERRLMAFKLPAAKAFARANGIDRVVMDSPRRGLGLIAAGKVYLDVREALRELGLTEARAQALGVRLYKVGMVWPLEDEGALAFCRGHQDVLVVDEKRPVIEEQLARLLYALPADERPRLLGKQDEQGRELVPAHGERSVNELIAILTRRLRALGLADDALNERMDALDARRQAVLPIAPTGTLRTPYFCSGCPHNSSTKTIDQSKTFTGVGCYGMIPMVMPQRETQWAAQMGAEGTLWVGMQHFVKTPHAFQNLGDGTYFHSGILAIRAAIGAKANITYKLLYNHATAMTGGQPVDGELSVEMMANQLHWEGVKQVVVVTDEPDKYPAGVSWPRGTEVRHRSRLEATQRELQQVPGVTAIIYDQTCAAEKRRLRKKGQFPDPDRRVFINQDVCEGCGDCTTKSNCMSVQPLDTEFGRKRHIDQSGCNKDFSCIEGFCPSFVTVQGGSLRKAAGARQEAAAMATLLAALPRPGVAQAERPYNILLTGIGGSGVLTVGAILGMAAHLDGLDCSVMDVTGMAQKGGSVLSNIRIAPRGAGLFTPRLWQDSTDLLLGCDLIVTAGPLALQTLRAGSGHVVVNSDVVPTAQFQTNQKIDFNQAAQMATLRKHAGAGFVHEVDATELTRRLMGDSIGTNIFMLGFAAQKGLLPLSLEAVEEAVRLNGVSVEANLQTLRWGRLAAHDPTAVAAMARQASGDPAPAPLPRTLDELLASRERLLTAWQNPGYARSYRTFIDQVRAAEAARVGTASTQFTETVARVLARLMAYKDEFEVARLYSSGDFERRLKSEFDGAFTLRFHLAPPGLARRNDRGELLKRDFGGWMAAAFGWLARFKSLRPTPLNVFGYTEERRMERRLIGEYRALVERVLPRLGAGNLAEAVELVRLHEDVKGFGHVKLANLQRVQPQVETLLARYEAPPAAAEARPAVVEAPVRVIPVAKRA